MRRIRSCDTSPELIVRKVVYGLGYLYRLHVKHLPGKPDLVFKKRKKIIFVHGCFWHQHELCSNNRYPKSNTSYWIPKLRRNLQRDKENQEALIKQEWNVLVIWECETADIDSLKIRLQKYLYD
jgi:DNA mismatch endonuclease (patch repair protein)